MVGQSPPQSKQEVVVLGIDSALRKLGVCVWHVGYEPLVELIQFPKLRGTKRLVAIINRIRELVEEHRPVLAAIEGYSYDSVGRWFDLGEVGGAIKVDLMFRDISTMVVPPSSLKKFVTDNGQASKARMIREVNARYLTIPVDDDNLADAVGLARFAYVAYTGDSDRRCELQSVKNLQKENDKKPKQVFKKFWVEI